MQFHIKSNEYETEYCLIEIRIYCSFQRIYSNISFCSESIKIHLSSQYHLYNRSHDEFMKIRVSQSVCQFWQNMPFDHLSYSYSEFSYFRTHRCLFSFGRNVGNHLIHDANVRR